mmetsp:Transcript_5941/g.20231  ORF Transcript_5941/g.20231 Transcript_5941/m.20231 type:complete len:292 (+) Transcript_5941:2057-2932(+)
MRHARVEIDVGDHIVVPWVGACASMASSGSESERAAGLDDPGGWLPASVFNAETDGALDFRDASISSLRFLQRKARAAEAPVKRKMPGMRGTPGLGAPLAPCTFLSTGQAYEGTQNVSHNSSSKEEAWKVNVRLQGCDLETGYICGSMEALNVPSAESSVVTFWEGEIVDNVNHTFFTSNWGAGRDTDVKHWSRFPSFAPLKDAVSADGGRNVDLSNYPYLFMRWKEKFFVNVGPDCGLTIAGFYYVSFSRVDGSIDGFYFDPNSSPFQKLELAATCEGRQGFSFASYKFR